MCVKGRNVRDESAVKFRTPSLHGERGAHVIFVTRSLNFLLQEKSKEYSTKLLVLLHAKVARIKTPASIFLEELFASRSSILQDKHAFS